MESGDDMERIYERLGLCDMGSMNVEDLPNKNESWARRSRDVIQAGIMANGIFDTSLQ